MNSSSAAERDTTPALLIAMLVSQLGPRCSAALRPLLAQHGVSETQFLALSFVTEARASTAGALARLMDYDPGAMTRMVDVLEQRGLLLRSRSLPDRRSIALEITPDGRSIVEDCRVDVGKFWNRVLGDWTADETQALSATLTALVRSLCADSVRSR